MIKLSNAQLWVHDQDEALAFYTDKLGWEVRADVTVPELGNFRWLTVGPPAQQDIAVTLMAIPGPPLMDAASAKQLRDLLGKGFAGTLLPDHRRRSRVVRGAEGTRRRVSRGARGAPVRDRLGVPRPVRQSVPAHPGPGAGDRLTAGRRNALQGA